MFYLILSCAGMVLLAVVLNNLRKTQRYDSELKRRAVLAPNEQILFRRLKESLPEHVVLAQVSFNALLATKLQRTRLKYQAKAAKFVVLDQADHVLAIVELDESSPLKRLKRTVFQDSLLEHAGYRVIRYASMPDIQQIQHDVLKIKPSSTGKRLLVS